MKQKIKYRNADGREITLNRGGYLISEDDLRSFTWEYNAYNRPSGFGGRVVFSRGVQEKSLTIGIRGGTAKEFSDNVEALLALTEPDIRNETPGRLYIGNQYLTCYLAADSKIKYYSERANWVKKELLVVAVESFWQEEITYHFVSGASTAIIRGKRYTGRYPCRYIAEISSREILNEHYSPSPMIIAFYGPVKNPRIIVGGNEYSITADIVSGQRIIIDQLRRTIVAQNPDGAETNLFDRRNKEHDVFALLPVGNQQVIYTGEFGFDITVIVQRSEPKWI